jgi:hypothetical protein
MRRILVPIVLVLLLLGTGWLVLGGGVAPRAVADAEVGSTRAPVSQVERRAVDASDEKAKAEPRRARSKDEREVLRRRIVEALASRERAAAENKGGTEDEDAGGAGKRAKRAGGAAAEEGPAAAGTMVDRSGNHGYLLKVMNEELMPLVDECYELARASRPELAGTLVLDVQILGDEDIGGVVDSIAPANINEIDDPTLNECVRESLLSITLPAPPTGGKDAIWLSMPLSPDAPK